MGFISGGANLNEPSSGQIATLFGVETRLGVQLSDLFAVMYQGSLTLLWPDLRDAVLVEVSLTRYLSFGAGIGVDWILAVPSGAGGLDHWVSVGAPLRLAVNIPLPSTPGQRRAFAIGVELTPGTLVGGSSDFYPNSGYTLGALGSLSFEMY